MKASEKSALAGIRRDLLALATPEKKSGAEWFFKEKTNFLGCTFPDMNAVARKWLRALKADGWAYDRLLAFSERLMKRGTMEETVVALGIVEAMRAQYRPEDFALFERWLKRYITNWANTDSIGPHVIGEFLAMYPGSASRVFKWTKSKNRWVRRAAAVSYVLHGRHGRFHPQIFRTARAMLADGDEMVQKGVGWMLKTASESDEAAVVAFVQEHKRRMPRLMVRYAAEKMTPANRKLVMAK